MLEYAATGFLTLGAKGRRMIIGDASVSTTEKNLDLEHDDLKPVTVGPVDAALARHPFRPCDSSRANLG